MQKLGDVHETASRTVLEAALGDFGFDSAHWWPFQIVTSGFAVSDVAKPTDMQNVFVGHDVP
jgi:hypothetical protein